MNLDYLNVEILVAEHQLDLASKLQKWINNSNIDVIISTEYAITKGMFSVLIIYKSKEQTHKQESDFLH